MAYNDLATALQYFQELQVNQGEDAVQPKLNAWLDQLREMSKAGINVAQPVYVLTWVQQQLNMQEIQKAQTQSETGERQPGPDAYKKRHRKATLS